MSMCMCVCLSASGAQRMDGWTRAVCTSQPVLPQPRSRVTSLDVQSMPGPGGVGWQVPGHVPHQGRCYATSCQAAHQGPPASTSPSR